MTGRTGGQGGRWIELDRPKPPRVAVTGDGATPPLFLSARCEYWLRQISRGWLPNRRISMECGECQAQWFGVHLWEFRQLLSPAIEYSALRRREAAWVTR